MFRIYEALAYPACSNEDLATDPDTKLQVCTSFCNATHYWYAPVCRNYDDVAGACGLGVVGSGFATQLPNTMNEPKRCDGFALNYAAPNGSAADAGTRVPDGGAGQTADAAAPTSNSDGTVGAEPVAPRPHHNGGCSVSAADTSACGRPGTSAAALLLLGVSFVRRTRRARRPARDFGSRFLPALFG
jgi:hypothetical protein